MPPPQSFIGMIWEFLTTNFPLIESNGATPVNIQDQTSPAFLVKANQVVASSSLATQALKDSYSFEVVDATGFTQGHYLGIFNTTTNRYYVGNILTVVDDTITMDTPLDSQFEIGDLVGAGITSMDVDGSVTPQEFTVRGLDPGLDIEIDITRMIFTCLTTNAVTLTGFGDIAGGLTRGLAIKRRGGSTKNIINLKDNIGMKGVMFDWDSLDDSNPGQGLHGFVGRLTFGGQNKIGVVLRIGPDEEIVFVIQDDLSSLLSFEVMLEGHEVTD